MWVLTVTNGQVLYTKDSEIWEYGINAIFGEL